MAIANSNPSTSPKSTVTLKYFWALCVSCSEKIHQSAHICPKCRREPVIVYYDEKICFDVDGHLPLPAMTRRTRLTNLALRKWTLRDDVRASWVAKEERVTDWCRALAEAMYEDRWTSECLVSGEEQTQSETHQGII